VPEGHWKFIAPLAVASKENVANIAVSADTTLRMVNLPNLCSRNRSIYCPGWLPVMGGGLIPIVLWPEGGEGGSFVPAFAGGC
jgi:hypothetical protein